MRNIVNLEVKNKPLLTVITITFNLVKNKRVKYFEQCLSSVHHQNYPNIEHIVIDGGSRDGTLDLIKKYAKDGWVKYISEPDKGVYDAMNKGIKLAKGKYIAFLNSDDFYHNDKAVELSVKSLESEEYDYSFADTIAVNGINDEVLGPWRGNINLLPFGIHYCHQSMFIKTELLRSLGGFDANYKISADSDLMIKLVNLGKSYIYIPVAIVSYRSEGVSTQLYNETRKEHSSALYNYLGKKIGLTKEECYLIWNFSLFSEKGFIDCIRIGKKLESRIIEKNILKNFLVLVGFYTR